MIASLRAVVARSLRLPRRRQLLGTRVRLRRGMAGGRSCIVRRLGCRQCACRGGWRLPAPIDLRRYPICGSRTRAGRRFRPLSSRSTWSSRAGTCGRANGRRPTAPTGATALERCVRSAALRKPICVPAKTPDSERHPVACDNADQNVLNQVCFRYAVVNPGRLSGLFVQVNWTWAARGWRAEYGEDDGIGSRDNLVTTYLRRKGVTGPIAEKRTYYCFPDLRETNRLEEDFAGSASLLERVCDGFLY